MILEVADIRIQPGRQLEFEAAIRRGAAEVIARARGFRGYSIHHGVESPERYLLHILWDTLEDHMPAFREGPLFAQWRAIVGPFFVAPPQVEHFELIAQGS